MILRVAKYARIFSPILYVPSLMTQRDEGHTQGWLIR